MDLFGAAILTLGVPAGIIGAIWGISSSFYALKANESAGIGAVGGGIQAAFYSVIFFTIPGLVGACILLAGGVIKMHKFNVLK
jgi:biopolymer transport protein ExbB/TolQ